MKVSTNQTGRTMDRGRRATRDIRPARAKPITGYCFERRFCGVLIALIFTTVAIVSVVLIHLPGRPVERLDDLVAINSANGAGLQRAAVVGWR
jgi:hypothetical protein